MQRFPHPHRLPPRRSALAAAALLSLSAGLVGAPGRSAAQGAEPALPAGGEGPVVIEADRLSGRPDRETVAEGQVEFRRGPLRIKAERIEYSQPTDTARASGNVEVSREGNVFRGPELQLEVQRFQGWFREPSYFFERTQAGGSARIGTP